MSTQPEIDRLLVAWRDGDPSAFDALTPLVYDELRKLAERYLRGEPHAHTLQTTALVHEAYTRLAGTTEMSCQNRAQFMGFMARVMRHILVDRARARNTAKRGMAFHRVDLDEAMGIGEESDSLVIELDDALSELRKFDELKSRIIELRFFGGLTYEETADALDIPVAALERELRLAKAWLLRSLQRT